MTTVTHLISYSMVFFFSAKKSIITTLGSLKWHLLTVKSILRVCVLGPSSIPITSKFDEYWTRTGFQTTKYVTNHDHNSTSNIRFSQTKCALLSDYVTTALQCQSLHIQYILLHIQLEKQEEKHTFDWRETII